VTRHLARARAQSGQAVTEAILLLVLLFGFTYMIATQFRNQEFVRQMVSGPWQNLAGVLQNGVWAPVNVGAAMHPNAHSRHITIEGDRPQ